MIDDTPVFTRAVFQRGTGTGTGTEADGCQIYSFDARFRWTFDLEFDESEAQECRP